MRSNTVTRLASIGLALTLLALTALSLVGVAHIRRSVQAMSRSSELANAFFRADDALTSIESWTGPAAVDNPDAAHDHQEFIRALDEIGRVGGPDDGVLVTRLHALHADYHVAAARRFAATRQADQALADRIDREEVAPTIRHLDAAVDGAANIYAARAQDSVAELRQTVTLVFVVTLGCVVLVVCLVAVFIVVVTNYQRSLLRQSELTAHQALHDALTGLPNRSLFTDRLAQALASTRRNGTSLAVMLLDLDRFKEVNDTLGHHHGDNLLRQIATRLGEVVRETDTIARLSGDEFAVLIPGADATSAGELADRVLRSLHRSFILDDVTVDVEASIGLALAPAHGETVEEIMRSADVAMYGAKDAKTGIVVYEPTAVVHQPSRLLLLGELRRALDAPGQLVLHYQPKVGLDLNQLCGVEALVRWNHPTRGLVPPSEFIPVAESTGLINRLTTHVLNLAVAQARAWLDAGLEIPVAVNLSPRCLLDVTLLDRVRGLLQEYDLPAGLLRLEVTETAVMGNPALALDTLTGLHGLGVRLSIDDYGTGYSSMAYLKRLPVDELKVDRSFVLNMTDSDNDAILVRSAIDLGHNLGLTVVAEGVERADHVDALTDLGCDIAQGYHYARPMPAHQIMPWIRAAGRANRELALPA